MFGRIAPRRQLCGPGRHGHVAGMVGQPGHDGWPGCPPLRQHRSCHGQRAGLPPYGRPTLRRRCPSYHLRCTAESSCRLGGNHRAHRRQCCHNRGSDCRRRACCSTHHSSVDIQRAGQQGGEVSESWFCASPRHARGSNQLGMTPCGRRFQQRGPIRATGRELCSCASTAVACHCQGSTFVSSRGRR